MAAVDYIERKQPSPENLEKSDALHLESGVAHPDDAQELAALEESTKLTGYVIYLSIIAGLAGFLFGCKYSGQLIRPPGEPS